MAVIEKIRQRSGLLIFIIGLALVTFLVSDAINSNMSLFNGSDNTVGVIKGNEITYQDFDGKIKVLSESVEKQGQPVNDFTLNMIRDQVWNEYFQKMVIDEQYEDLGIEVTGAEMRATVMNPVDFPQIRDAAAFKNEVTQQFDPAKVEQYINQMDQDPSGDAKRNWVNFEQTSIKPQLKQRKYNTLISKGIYKTSLEVKAEFLANNASSDAKVVGFMFNSIPDDSVAVSEEEMEDYLKTHTEDYQQEASRRIEYVVFDLSPSAEDSASTLKWALDKKPQFAKAANDTFFIQPYGVFDTTFKPRGSFPAVVEDSIFNGTEKTVYGPVFDAGEYKLFKVLAFKEDTLPYIKASQILIKPAGAYGKEDSLYALQRANNIANALRKGADFTKMAKDSSQDFRTAANGGDLGWLKKGSGALQEVVERNLYSTPEGGIVVVRSSAGVHILKVTGAKTYRTVNVGQIGQAIQYSSNTDKEVYDKAFEFLRSSQEGTSFTDNAEKSGYVKRISPDLKEGETALPGMTNARDVIRWAFHEDTEVGSVSKEVLNIEDKYIVAQLVNVKEKGTAKLEDVKEKLEADTRTHKKAEILKKRIEAAMGGTKTIEQIALDLGAIVNASPNTLFANPNIPFIGADPILVGAITGAELNKISGPVETKNGVFIFVVSARTNPEAPSDLNPDRTRLIMEASGQAPNRAFEALKKKADIKDYRYKFF